MIIANSFIRIFIHNKIVATILLIFLKENYNKIKEYLIKLSFLIEFMSYNTTMQILELVVKLLLVIYLKLYFFQIVIK